MIVSYKHLAIQIDPNADRVVSYPLAAYLTHVLALVVEDLDAVRPIVADKYLLAVIRAAAAVRKLQVLRAVELLQHIAHQIEDQHAHHLALNHNDTALGVHADTARMLQDVSAELAQEVAVLVVNLDLVGGRALRYYNVACVLHNSHSVRVEQLTLALPALAELELEASLAVEYLDAVRISVGHDYLVVRVDSHARRLRELAVRHAELAELAVVDHFRAFQLRPGRQQWIICRTLLRQTCRTATIRVACVCLVFITRG